MFKPIVLSATLLGCLAGSPPAEDPMPITTDTPEYCLGLAQRMGSHGDMPANARVLWQRGRSMCEHGDVRSGLARLRRAMLVLRGAAE